MPDHLLAGGALSLACKETEQARGGVIGFPEQEEGGMPLSQSSAERHRIFPARPGAQQAVSRAEGS